MKKIILSITSIIIGAIIAITLVLVFYDKKREVYVKSSYNDVRLSLGKTKVKEINVSMLSSIEEEREYYILNPYDFYEKQIKTSEYYNSKLVFTDKYDNIYGYLIKDEVAFKYRITDEVIALSTMAINHLIYSDYSLILCDFYGIVGVNSEMYSTYNVRKWTFYYETEIIKYNDVVELYKCMNADMVKIGDDVIYLKGYDDYLNMSDNYIVKIVNIDGYACGYLYDYQLKN